MLKQQRMEGKEQKLLASIEKGEAVCVCASVLLMQLVETLPQVFGRSGKCMKFILHLVKCAARVILRKPKMKYRGSFTFTAHFHLYACFTHHNNMKLGSVLQKFRAWLLFCLFRHVDFWNTRLFPKIHVFLTARISVFTQMQFRRCDSDTLIIPACCQGHGDREKAGCAQSGSS
jgi:hypothetical protein